MVAVQIRYWAGAAAAAGVEEETIAAETLADALTTARETRGAALGKVLSVSSLLVDGQRQRPDQLDRPLTAPTRLEVLPPFAGG
ncbi:MoaD/ThiS family protein [Naumannella sp. ID2617S]|uniref:Molybdopterin synthase sulfur carrier subunit n=1 Tax=Enemella dayhoffiae TaxID=2016507 RepID=A0A255H6J8_9ACTN|nr:MoaD/ThiS family protein [Enemella dayhoffiae]NNG20749.1 MoaD/ThiS family protein [Naumannella sp. ID2617S]OYO22823.1 molybdopterin synthase sulfur carrier subunit [Enemella dayhoffiae]